MQLHTILAPNTLTNKGVQAIPLKKSEPLLSSSNSLALQTDTFVKQPQTTTLQSQPISEPRMGELSLPKDLTPFLIPAIVTPVGLGILYWAATTSAKDSEDIFRRRMLEALEAYDDLKKDKEKLKNNKSQMLDTFKKSPTIRNRSGSVDKVTTNWFKDNVLPSLVSEAITSSLKLPFEYFEKLEAKELEKQINERDRKFQQELLVTQEMLAQKIETSFAALKHKKQLLTPSTFLELIPNLGLSPEQTELFRTMANQVIITLNDNKPLQNNKLDYGIQQLTYATRFRNQGKPLFEQRVLETGIRSIEDNLDGIHSMLQYKAQHTLAKLFQKTAEVQTQLGNPNKAEEALFFAELAHQLALENGASARFVAGFLEGLIDYQGTQFSENQTRTLQQLLNLVANDVRPLINVKNAHPLRLEHVTNQLAEAQERLGYIEKRLALDPNRYGGYSYGEALSRETAKKQQQNLRQQIQALETRKKWLDGGGSIFSSGLNYERLKHEENVKHLNQLSPFPQTYEEELPHREVLLTKGVKFEPYSNV